MYLKYLFNAGDFSLQIPDIFAGGEYWISNNYYQQKSKCLIKPIFSCALMMYQSKFMCIRMRYIATGEHLQLFDEKLGFWHCSFEGIAQKPLRKLPFKIFVLSNWLETLSPVLFPEIL